MRTWPIWGQFPCMKYYWISLVWKISEFSRHSFPEVTGDQWLSICGPQACLPITCIPVRDVRVGWDPVIRAAKTPPVDSLHTEIWKAEIKLNYIQSSYVPNIIIMMMTMILTDNLTWALTMHLSLLLSTVGIVPLYHLIFIRMLIRNKICSFPGFSWDR